MVFVANSAGDRGDILLCRPHRHSRFQPPHDVVILVSPAIHSVGAERERKQYFHFLDRCYGGYHFVVEQEIRTQHSSHRVFLATQRKASSNDPRIATEQPFPHTICKQRHRRFSWLVFFGEKGPAEQCFCAKHIQQG